MIKCITATNRCPNLIYCTSDNHFVGAKKLDKYCYYCNFGHKIKKLGNGGTFTGSAPRTCYKRKKEIGQEKIKNGG